MEILLFSHFGIRKNSEIFPIAEILVFNYILRDILPCKFEQIPKKLFFVSYLHRFRSRPFNSGPDRSVTFKSVFLMKNLSIFSEKIDYFFWGGGLFVVKRFNIIIIEATINLSIILH